jgi:hypothetical protein
VPVAGIMAPAVLGVLRDLLPDVCRGQPFGHAAMLSARSLDQDQTDLERQSRRPLTELELSEGDPAAALRADAGGS